MELLNKTAALAEIERERLASGQRPASRFQNKIQRMAVKALAVFFALILAFTLLSRAAVGVTIARVDVERPMTGILTQRTTVSGSMEALGDLEIILPGGIRVNKINASVGQRVNVGDVLLELDGEALTSAVEKLRNDLSLLDLKIDGAAKGNTGSATDQVLNAQVTLRNAQEDYDRLTLSRATAEERSAEDLVQIQADYNQAAATLEKAKIKAKDELVKTAQENVETVKKTQEATKESAKEALDAAQEAINSAQDQHTAVDSSYYSALSAYSRAEEALDRAEASGDESAIAAAQSALDQAQAMLNSADASSNSAYRALKRTKENLKALQEKWDDKLKTVEAEVSDATAKLAEVKNKTDMSEEAIVVSAQSALDNAERSLRTAQRSNDDVAIATADQLLAAQRGIENAERALSQAESAAADQRLSDQNARRQAEVERLGYVNERRETQKKLDGLLTAAANGGKVTAPVGGVVLTILSETGLTAEGGTVATLSRSDGGFEFVGKVDQNTAEKLAPGDEGTLFFTADGKSYDLRVKITAIGVADETGMVEVSALLPEGNYPVGGSAKLELSKRSEQYNTVLPLGALRNDGEDYVLVLREKQTVMGTEQTVEKVPVQVEERDSESMAVSGALAYDAQVVVGAAKPISEGDRVRVNENP